MEATKRPPNIGLKRPPNVGLIHLCTVNQKRGQSRRTPEIVKSHKPLTNEERLKESSSQKPSSVGQKPLSVKGQKPWTLGQIRLLNFGLIFGLLLSTFGCCDAECNQQQSDILNCELRTLGSSLNDTKNSEGQNFGPEISKAKEIHIGCTDNGLESILRTNHFGYLPHLKKLSIKSCLVKKMPALAFSGLSGLQGLNFVNNVRQQGRNEAKVILEIEPDAFTGLNDLRSLNFRYV